MPRKYRAAAAALSLFACLFGGLPAHGAPVSDRVALNFNEAEIDGVARAMAVLLGKTVLVDPRVKGKVTLWTEEAVNPREAYAMFLTQLRGLGFAVVEVAGVLKIVPEADAKLQAPASAGVVRGDQVVTRVFRLQFENANNLVSVLRPLITPSNTVNVNPGNNSLIVTDYAANLERLDALITALDTPSATDVEVIRLQHAVAAELASTVQRLAEGAGGAAAPGGSAGGSAGGTAASVLADSRINALLVRAGSPARLASIRALVARMDQPGEAGVGGSNVHVIYLKNAEATRLATVLRAAFPGDASRAGGGQGASGAGPSGSAANAPAANGAAGNGAASAQATAPVTAAAQPSTGGFIQADPATNSLIVTAPEPLFREVNAVVEKLDSPRAQLYVESLVVEVDASKALDVGLQWKQLFNLSSTSDLTLGTVAQALEQMSGTNILSTANLVTLDNEEAKIVVGQNVPFVTGQFTSSSGSASNPFQTIERKDVGITLRIRPQIGTRGKVRMTIFQESSSVSSSTSPGTTNAGPTTNKRAIESNVVVADGKIIVLGGLIEDSATRDTVQVPVVGSLPVIGALFRSLSRSHKKTNLVVFLRPVVLHDDEQADGLAVDRYEQIRARQRQLVQDPANAVDGQGGPVLPALTPRAQPAAGG